MEWLKTFSTDYANAVTAFVAILALLITSFTLLYLRREYRAKYRPYVVPVVNVEPYEIEPGKIVYVTSVRPLNIGPHPCYIKLKSLQLQIGDELHETPSGQAWSLIGPNGAAYTFPVGHINEHGIEMVRSNRYRQNRIEVRFQLHAKSVDDEDVQIQQFIFEIEVKDVPIAVSRPEWVTQLGRP